MSAEEFSRYDSMKLFLHQIYEFQKGVRSLVLCTMCRTCASLLSERLERLGIAYRIQSVTDSKVNLYFGNRMCLETVATFIHKPLNELSAEEDFMLGAMLGFALGSIGTLWNAISLSFASGAMLYVVFGELLPESILMWRSKLPSVAILIGVLVGMLIINA